MILEVGRKTSATQQISYGWFYRVNNLILQDTMVHFFSLWTLNTPTTNVGTKILGIDRVLFQIQIIRLWI